MSDEHRIEPVQDDAPTPLAPTSVDEIQLPASAGQRANRRIRRGRSLLGTLWFAVCVAGLPGLAALVAYLSTTAPQGDISTPAQLEQATSLPSLTPLLSRVDTELTGERQRVQGLCELLVSEFANARPEPKPTETGPVPPTDAEIFAMLRTRLQGLTTAIPDARGAIIDSRGNVVHATGDLTADAPALKSQLAAVLSNTALPPPLVGAISKAAPNAYRVAIITPAPALDATLVDSVQEIEQRAQQQLVQARAAVAQGSEQGHAADSRSLRVLAATIVATALALLVLAFGVALPLRRGLTLLNERTTRRAIDEEVTAGSTLPLELAATDELLAAAFDTARAGKALRQKQTDLLHTLQELTDVCQRSADGDLSNRAPVEPGPAQALAIALNLLIEDFERRALRLRSHAVNLPQQDAEDVRPDDNLQQLRLRAQTLGPIPQLLADISTRLRSFIEAVEAGTDISADMHKLSEAVMNRARTARGYLQALSETMDALEQTGASPNHLARAIEQELADLTLDSSFPSQVSALQDLGAQEIRRRLDQQAGSAEPKPELSE